MISKRNSLIRLSFLILFSVAIFACENELNEEFVEIENARSGTLPILPVGPLDPIDGDPIDPPNYNECGSYGVYPDNPEKDCGWKRGIEDYVFQYNHIVNREDLGPCYNMTYTVISGTSTLILTYDDGSSAFYTFNKKATFGAGKVSSGYFIPEMVRIEFDEYIERITRDRNDSDFAMGQYLGYMSASGQEPLSSADTNCSSGSAYPFN